MKITNDIFYVGVNDRVFAENDVATRNQNGNFKVGR